MGIAVDVDFATNRFVYVCASRDYASSGGWSEQVLRYTTQHDHGSWIERHRAAGRHARPTRSTTAARSRWIASASCGSAWATPANEPLAQNRNSLNGKILRINRDGSDPVRQPRHRRDAQRGLLDGSSQPAGHRHPAGHRPGVAAEHGPDVNDEINLIDPGGNYGWPCYTGAGSPYHTTGCGPATSYRESLWSSGDSTIATSGAAFAGGTAVAGLRRQAVRQHPQGERRPALLDQPRRHDARCPATHFNNSWGRLRAMVSGPGGQLYMTTSNGSNDRVIRISPSKPPTGRVSGTDRYRRRRRSAPMASRVAPRVPSWPPAWTSPMPSPAARRPATSPTPCCSSSRTRFRLRRRPSSIGSTRTRSSSWVAPM